MAKKKQPEQQPEQPRDIREMTADTIGRDILRALVQEIKLLPKPWGALPKAKQDDVIDRLRDRVDYNVKMAVHLIASHGRTVVQGDLDQVTIKDGAKIVIKIGRGAESLHELYDAQGRAVLIVVAAAEDHTAGMDDVCGEDDQRAMDLGHEYHDNDGGGMDDNIVDAEIKTIEHQPLQAELDEAYQQGYEAAGDGLGQDACPVMSGPLCIEWVKGWKAWHAEQGESADEAEGAME